MTYYRSKKLLVEGGYVELAGKKHVLTSVGREALAAASLTATKTTTVLPKGYHGSSPQPQPTTTTTTTTLKSGSGGSSSASGSVADSLDGEDGEGGLPWP